MKIDNTTKVKELLEAVEKCTGQVYLRSAKGDCYNLKSELSMYVAIGALIQDKGQELELFCDNKDDEYIFFELFNKDPDIL